MSILGYSTAYFLPQYWVNTPLYGEKIIPLLDYILSTDYANTDQLATAFYNIESKYTNTADLPIEAIEEVIDESGYTYIRNLLGNDEDSLRLLVYTLVMVHQLKGSKKGIETVLDLLKSGDDELEIAIVGDLDVNEIREATNFSTTNFVTYSNFSIGSDPFEITFQIITGNSFGEEQCIASSSRYGFYLGINTAGKLVLKLGQQVAGIRGWQLIDGEPSVVSQRTLAKNTSYYITFAYSGYDYSVRVSLDGENYTYYIAVDSATPLDIHNGIIFLGIDKSEGELRYPFNGTISLAPFAVSSSNVRVTQWFETFPVGDEDTYEVEAEVDLGLVSSDFFVNFAKFAEKYVYPTLKAFRARLTLRNKITFLPYVRYKVDYIASNVMLPYKEYFDSKVDGTDDHEPFKVEDELASSEHEYMMVPNNSGG